MSKHLRNLGQAIDLILFLNRRIVSIFCITEESFEKMKMKKKVYAKHLMKLYIFQEKTFQLTKEEFQHFN